MKRKILWLGLSFLLVAALVLTGCPAPVVEEPVVEEPVVEEPVVEEPVVEEPVVEEPVVAPPVGEPQHGGTLTFFWERSATEPPTWDQADGSWIVLGYLAPFGGRLLRGEIETYGPRGTNEFAFELQQHIPDKYFIGDVAESWEVTTDPLGALFHIRPGIMWTGNDHIGMEPRELTAYDVEFCLNRNRASPAPTSSYMMFMPEGGFVALDRYTLQVHFDMFNPEWARCFAFGRFGVLYPPEVVEAGAADWRHQTGTGPFVLEKYVKGSNATYRPNPNWWDKELIINGKKYDTPFIDKLVYPIILDESTKIAALRTGKLDISHEIGMKHKSSLSSTCPELTMQSYRRGGANVIIWMCVKGGPTADKDIRRAMMIGTDMEAIVRTIFTEGDVNCLPFNAGMGTDLWTPIEDLPPEIKVLFEYNPDLAAQMIIDAGYPDGLTLTLDYPSDSADCQATAPLLEDMWTKIGVELILQPHEMTVIMGMDSTGTWEHGLMRESWGNTKAISGFDKYRHYPHYPWSTDEYHNANVDKAMAELDEAKMNAMCKELSYYEMETAWQLPLGNPYVLNCWWPWVKNYYGECEAGYNNYNPMLSRLWIDQDLKAEMGY